MLEWCKVASNLDMHPKIRRAGNFGREVFLFALRKNAEMEVEGLVPDTYMEPWYLAYVLMMSEADAQLGLQQAQLAGLLVQQDKCWHIVGWDADEWGRPDQTDTQRTKRVTGGLSRANSAIRGPNGAFLPKTDQLAGPAKTQLEPANQLSQVEENRIDKKRVEEKRETPRKRGTPLDPAWVPSITIPNGKAAAKARARGVNLDDELDKLKNWAASKGEVGKDWDARWRLWLSNARPSNNGAQPRTLTNADVLPGLLAKIRDGEEQDRKLEGADS